jgi:hypothetical protein
MGMMWLKADLNMLIEGLLKIRLIGIVGKSLI